MTTTVTGPEYIIADRALTVWNFYQSQEAAQADLPRVLGEKASSLNQALTLALGDRDDWAYWSGRAEELKTQQWAVTTWEEFSAAQDARILGQPLYEITEEQYNDMLEVLPPLNWAQRDGFDSFFMSEFDTGNYTRQYARRNGRFFYKVVNYRLQSTWIKQDMIAQAVKAPASN